MEKYLIKRSRVFRWAVGGLLLMLGSLPWMASLQAAGVVGTGTPGSCTQTALTAALAGGGTVTFNCGGAATIPAISQMTIYQETVIEGGGLIKITGGLVTRLFDVPGSLTSLTLNDLTLDSANSAGSGNGHGGAIRSVGTLVLNNVTIQFSQTNGCGGAILSDGTTIISNSIFDKNTGAGAGGAICTGVTATNRLQITNSIFSNNLTLTTDPLSGFGGAIYVDGPVAEVTIMDSGFTSNSARFGGALFVKSGGAATLRTQDENAPNRIFFLSNSVTHDGGAIWNQGTLNIHKADFNLNTAPQNAAGIGYGAGIANLGTLTISDSHFSLNKGRLGGGLFVGIDPNARADVRRTIFSQNEASEFGGGLGTGDAVYNTGATVTVNDSVFRNNFAGSGGGGAYRHNALLTIANSSFTDNRAFGVGGGLFSGAGPNTDPTSVNLTNVTFSENLAGSNQGGGIYSNGGSSVLKNLTLVNNSNGLYQTGTLVRTRLSNSVLDNPVGLNCAGIGTPIPDGHNLSTDSSCAVETNLTPALLGPREINANGINQTRFHLPLANSPLINAAANCPTLDQRGLKRPNACDIGAIEYGGLAWNTFLPLIEK